MYLRKSLIVFILLSFVLSCSAAARVPGREDAGAAPRSAATAAELWALLQQNEGGVIKLTDDILWDSSLEQMECETPTILLMGDYGIEIPSNAIFSISGPLHFEGNGVRRPLFSVEGNLDLRGGEVVANGKGATAVYANKDVSLFYMSITAKGEDSTGIHATGEVQLKGCVVEAGKTPIVSEQGVIVIDGCSVAPIPECAEVIDREAVPGGRIQENGICVAEGESLDDVLSKNTLANYYLLDKERVVSISNYITGTNWTNLPSDTNTPGECSLVCDPIGVPEWMPIEGVDSFEVPLHIVAENQPHIEFASRFGWDTVMLKFFSEIKEAEKITLWYSSDNGQTWHDFEELPTADVSPTGAVVDALPPNQAYLFQLEVTGGGMAGKSQVLEFPYYDSDPDSWGGGDRTGVDRFPMEGQESDSAANGSGKTAAPSQDGNGYQAGERDGNPLDAVERAIAGGRSESSAPLSGTKSVNRAGDLLTNDGRSPASRLTAPWQTVGEPKEQPAFPKPKVDIDDALWVAGIAAVLLAAAALWVKRKKLRGR